MVVAKALLFLVLFLTAASVTAAESAVRTVLDGVYSSSQMTRGRTAYNRHCRGCHLDNLQGDGVEPPLIASLFLDAWREDYLASLFAFIQTRMPRGRDAKPGSLKEKEYLDIVAYILARNGFPAGTTELILQDLGKVLLVGADGPAPLPPNALMRSTGCLERTEQGWRLVQAAVPSRVREADETDTAEVAQSAQQPLGLLAFRLNNLEQLPVAAELPQWNGRKVQIKGVLNGSGDSARVFVLSFADTGLGCTTAP